MDFSENLYTFYYEKKKSAPSILKLILDNFFFILEVSFFNLMGFDQSISLLWDLIESPCP